ncbi:MAG: 3-deoxy-D-manno-octulosonic acid transferase [Alphaproteobacteria bacterium]|jgi:3-deoxy-D-manno-octulosonic-acid transferase|nr:3-deoxy-D-manno-octulosonic acid transferase [Alphaproteobacteria bacterium]
MMAVLYRILTFLLKPFINRHMSRRLREGKEDPIRIGERRGYPTRPRPLGFLVWVHAASVGESMSALTLIEGLLARDDRLHFLLTTGTVTSAKLMAKRLLKQAEHQYVPIDQLTAVRNFLDHWHPDLAIWVESEFWPNLVLETYEMEIPMILVNARISETSFKRWSRAPSLVRTMLGCFDLCIAQSLPDAGRLGTLGADNVTWVGNLKSGALPLPADERELDRISRAVEGRPCWLAASTHPGEEALIARVHQSLKGRFPGLLTIIAPRHPERGEEIRDALRRSLTGVSRRAGMEPITTDTEIYVADTLGELGVFYRAVSIAFVGGSLVGHGGHNPLEAARLDCAVLFGPHMENFEESVRNLDEVEAAIQVADVKGLEEELARLLGDPRRVARQAEAGLRLTEEGERVREALVEKIVPYLEQHDADDAYARA